MSYSLSRCGLRSSRKAGNDEVDDRVRQDGDDDTDDGIQDGVLGCRDRACVTAGKNVTDTTVNQHDNGNGTDDE
jgi:hypothetical protein